eukprot:scaffold366503_cov32-Prasinocladus_malaysianus.AAC.1
MGRHNACVCGLRMYQRMGRAVTPDMMTGGLLQYMARWGRKSPTIKTFDSFSGYPRRMSVGK